MEYNLEAWKYDRYLKKLAKQSDEFHQHIPNRSALLMGVDVDINSYGYRNKAVSVNPHEGVNSDNDDC